MSENVQVKRHFLCDEQKFQVYHYLVANKERLQKDRPDWSVAAAEVSRELQFHVTEMNLKNVCKACNITWEPKSNEKSPVVGWMKALRDHVGTLDSEVQRLTEQLNTLHGRLHEAEQENQRLRVAVNYICQDAGIKPPASAGVPISNAKSTSVVNGPR